MPMALHKTRKNDQYSIVCTKSTGQLWVKLKDLCPLQNKNERLKNKTGGMMASIYSFFGTLHIVTRHCSKLKKNNYLISLLLQFPCTNGFLIIEIFALAGNSNQLKNLKCECSGLGALYRVINLEFHVKLKNVFVRFSCNVSSEISKK